MNRQEKSPPERTAGRDSKKQTLSRNGRAGLAAASSSTAARLLERLEGVRRTGPDRWVALCPSHADKSPSLSIREADDGRLLVRCWAGCASAEIVAAIGLALRDLFPRALPGASPLPVRTRWDRADAWTCLQTEALIDAVAASDAARGLPLSPADAARVALAAERLADALSAFGLGGRA